MKITLAPFLSCLLALVLGLTGCSGETAPDSPPGANSGAGGAGGTQEAALPPLPEAPADSPEGILDRAAEHWGGRRALTAETGFYVRGKFLVFSSGQTDAIGQGNTEVWTRYEPFATRTREYVPRVDRLTGTETVTNEFVRIVNGDQAWETSLTGDGLEPRNELARMTQAYPTPRKVLLHREHHLNVGLRGKEGIPELGKLEAWRILAIDPSGNQTWVYVDTDFRLRKITFQTERGQWITVVFETFREGELGDHSRLEKVSQYLAGEKQRSYLWEERRVSPELPESLFRPR